MHSRGGGVDHGHDPYAMSAAGMESDDASSYEEALLVPVTQLT